MSRNNTNLANVYTAVKPDQCVMTEQTASHMGLLGAFWNRKQWRNNRILHNDNEPSDTSLTVQQLLLRNKIPTIHQPSYSADVLFNFKLLLRLRTGLKGNCFALAEEIQLNGTTGLTAILKEDFHRCFQQRQFNCSQVCVCVYVCVCARAEVKCFECD
jgi:hypothetical protein